MRVVRSVSRTWHRKKDDQAGPDLFIHAVPSKDGRPLVLTNCDRAVIAGKQDEWESYKDRKDGKLCTACTWPGLYYPIPR